MQASVQPPAVVRGECTGCKATQDLDDELSLAGGDVLLGFRYRLQAGAGLLVWSTGKELAVVLLLAGRAVLLLASGAAVVVVGAMVCSRS